MCVERCGTGKVNFGGVCKKSCENGQYSVPGDRENICVNQGSQGYCRSADGMRLTPGPCVGYFQIDNNSVIVSAASCSARVWRLRCEERCPANTYVNGSAQSQCKFNCSFRYTGE